MKLGDRVRILVLKRKRASANVNLMPVFSQQNMNEPVYELLPVR
jgi:hypothetical protein